MLMRALISFLVGYLGEDTRVNMKRVKSKFLKRATAREERVPSADQSTEKVTMREEPRTSTPRKR